MVGARVAEYLRVSLNIRSGADVTAQLADVSESSEMYLISIARLIERGASEPIGLARLAEELQIMPASVNEMVHKLEAEGSLAYEPYYGVSLTPAGRRIAQRVLRSRRLWETFLVWHLDLPPEEADALACRFEHVTPSAVVDRLESYLLGGMPQHERASRPGKLPDRQEP